MEAVKLGPDFQIGETFTYHHGAYKMTVLYPGDLSKNPVRWFGTGSDEVMFYPGAVLVPVPYFGWLYEVQTDGTLNYRSGN